MQTSIRRWADRAGTVPVLAALVLTASVGVALALESGAMRLPSPRATSSPGAPTALPADQTGAQQDAQQEQYDRSNADDPPHAAQPLTRAQAVALVQHRYRARVVRAHLLQAPGGRQLYELRLLSAAGMVWTVRIDAQSGAEVP